MMLIGVWLPNSAWVICLQKCEHISIYHLPVFPSMTCVGTDNVEKEK